MCLVPGKVLGDVQLVTVMPDPCNVAALMGEAATESGADEPGLRSERLIGEVCMEECLWFTDMVMHPHLVY